MLLRLDRRDASYSEEEVNDERCCDCACFSCDDRGTSIFCSGCISRKEPTLNGKTGQFPRPKKDACEHNPVETAGIGISQRWVVGDEQVKAVG